MTRKKNSRNPKTRRVKKMHGGDFGYILDLIDEILYYLKIKDSSERNKKLKKLKKKLQEKMKENEDFKMLNPHYTGHIDSNENMIKTLKNRIGKIEKKIKEISKEEIPKKEISKEYHSKKSVSSTIQNDSKNYLNHHSHIFTGNSVTQLPDEVIFRNNLNQLSRDETKDLFL